MKVKKCENCGFDYVPPINTCLECGEDNFSSKSISDTGKIEVWTTVYIPPSSHIGEEPYHIAIIELDEGPKLTARVKAESEKMEVGKRVEMISDEEFKLFEIV